MKKHMFRRITGILITFALSAGLVACGSESASPGSTDAQNPSAVQTAEKIKISVAGSGSVDGTDTGDVLYECQDALANKEGAEVEVVYYLDGKMGSDTDVIQSVQNGNIDIMTGAPSGLISMVPQLAIVDIPGLFSSVENCNEVLQGGLIEKLQPYFAEKGLYLLSWGCTGFRQLSSNKPIQSAQDIRGLDIRTMENAYHMAYWKALGANPTPLAWSEVYISLEQGLIDAQENPIDTFLGSKLNEVQDFFVLTYHVPFIEMLVMNLDKWNSLSESQQADLMDWAEDVHSELSDRLTASFDEKLDMLQTELGVEVVEFKEEDLEYMRSGNAEVIKMVKEKVDSELVDFYVSAAQEAEK